MQEDQRGLRTPFRGGLATVRRACAIAPSLRPTHHTSLLSHVSSLSQVSLSLKSHTEHKFSLLFSTQSSFSFLVSRFSWTKRPLHSVSAAVLRIAALLRLGCLAALPLHRPGPLGQRKHKRQQRKRTRRRKCNPQSVAIQGPDRPLQLWGQLAQREKRLSQLVDELLTRQSATATTLKTTGLSGPHTSSVAASPNASGSLVDNTFCTMADVTVTP